MNEDDVKAMEELYRFMDEGWNIVVTGSGSYFETGLARRGRVYVPNKAPWGMGSTLAEAVAAMQEDMKTKELA